MTQTFSGNMDLGTLCASSQAAAITAAAGLVTLTILAPEIGIPATAVVIFFIITPDASESGCCPSA
ncbi:MAG: hypothetical protein WC299_02405 [Kiritimatiellia bacterium]